MKFSEFLTSPGLRKLSVFIGLLAGTAIAMFTEWRYGVLWGAVIVLLASFILPVIFYFSMLPYAKLKKALPQPFLFDEPVQFTVKTGKVNGFFILTEGSMIFLSRECETPTLELSRDKVLRTVARTEQMTLDIYLNETQFIRVFSAGCEELIGILREHGWNVTQ